MANHPTHPDTDDQVRVGAERQYTSSRPWGAYVIVFIAIVVVLGFFALHVTGVLGPGAH